jgi:hypothetical protein
MAQFGEQEVQTNEQADQPEATQTGEQEQDSPDTAATEVDQPLRDVVQAETPESIAQAAKEHPMTRAAGVRLEQLIERAKLGDTRAEALIQEQADRIQNEVRGEIDYDEINEQRKAIPDFDQKKFDQELEVLSAVQRAKGLGDTATDQQGLPPKEGFDLETEKEKAKFADFEPGSPLDPDIARFQQPITGKKLEDLDNEITVIDQHIKATEQALNLINQGVIEESVDNPVEALRGKITALRKRKQMLQNNANSVRAAGLDSVDALIDKATRGGTDDIKIDGNSISFPLGKKFADFLYGLAGGKTMVEIQIAIKKFKNTLARNVWGDLPRNAVLLDIERVSAIQANMKVAQVTVEQLKRQLKKDGLDMNKPEVLKDLDVMLKTPDADVQVDGKPASDELKEIIKRMRNHIDKLSVQLIQSGLMDGPLMETLTENLGVYLHRSYQIHNDPDWIDKVQKDPDIWNPAKVWWEGKLQERKGELQDQIQKQQDKIEKYEDQLNNLDAQTSPQTVRDIIKRQDRAKDRKLELEEKLDTVNAQIDAPQASLVALMKDQLRTGSTRSKGLGAKDTGILKMRGGKVKQKAVKDARKKLNAARKKYQEAEKALNRANKLETTKEVDKTMQRAEQAWEELQRAQSELDKAFDYDLPPELRKLFGEYEGAITNYMMTVYKQSSLAANHAFLNKVKETGLEEGWLREPGDPVEGYETLIAAEENSVMAPLNGLRTSDEIARAFNDFNKAHESIMLISQLIYLSGVSKKWLTVYSHVGQIRNIISGGYFHALSGDFTAAPAGMAMYVNGVVEFVASKIPGAQHLKNSIIGPSLQKIGKTLLDKTNAPQWLRDQAAVAKDVLEANKAAFKIGRDFKGDDADLELYEELVALGLTDESVSFGLIKDALNEFKKGLTSPYSNIGGSPELRAGRAAGLGANQKIQGTYQAADTAHRVLRYMRDLRRYARSRNLDLDNMPPDDLLKFKQEIADIARRAYPTYSLMPKLVAQTGKSPVIGPFISFTYTATAAMHFNVAQGIQDIKNGDTGIGVSRFLGVLFANSTYSTMLNMIGGTLTGLVMGGGGDDMEDEDTDGHKWVEFLPSWSKFSKVSIFPADNGEFVYLDHGSQVPNTGIYETMTSALKGDFERAGDAFVATVLGPYFSSEIFTEAVLEAAYNTKELGAQRPIVHSEAEWYEKAYAKGWHVFDKVKPGTLTTIERLWKAGRNELGMYDYEEFNSYKFGPESLMATTGLRLGNGDVADAYRYRMFGLKDDMVKGLGVYRNEARKLAKEIPGITKGERLDRLKNKRELAIKYATGSVKKMIALYQAADNTNLDQQRLLELLKDSGVSKVTREGIINGKVVLPELDNIKD